MPNWGVVENPALQRKHVLWVRWLLVIATSYLLHFTGADTYGINDELILAYIASNLALSLLPHRFFQDAVLYYIMLPADTLFVCASIYLSGAASTDFYLTFFLIIIIAAIGRKLSYVVVGAAGITLFYGWMMWRLDMGIPPLRIPFLIVVAIFIGHLLEQGTIELDRWRKLVKDKRELEETQQLLRESEAKFRKLTETLTAPIFIHRGRRLLYVNPATETLTGYDEETLMGRSIWRMIGAESRAALARLGPAEKLSAKTPERLEVRLKAANGRKLWLDVNMGLIDYGGRPARLGTATDITDRKTKEYQLEHTASHDLLTGLPNRARLIQELEQLLDGLKDDGDEVFALLYLDLDRFKLVNDSLGHAVGDDLLVLVAERIRKCLRPQDLAARYGGDEFVILLKNINSIDDAMRVADRVHQHLMSPFDLLGQEIFISASIGIALSGPENDTPDALLRDADAAMYRAKASSKTEQRGFHTATHSRAAELVKLESDLRKALERDEFFLVYQPIIVMNKGTLAGFEVLVRWNHKEKGLVSPANFIPLAEESGVIIPLGWWVARQACRQLQEWYEQIPASRGLFMNINLSYRQFMQPDLVERVEVVLKETGLDPRRLNLEFTENVIVESTESTAVKLLLLKAMGVRLLIDDFGTGYTLLSHLHRFPMDMLKIDRSFVMNMGPTGENSELVQLIVTIATTMGVDVIAEGVETKYQQEKVQQLHCKYGQGFLYSKPLPTEQAFALIQEAFPPAQARTAS